MTEASVPKLEKPRSSPPPTHLHTGNRDLLQAPSPRPAAPGGLTRAASGPAAFTSGPVQAKKGGKDPERALRQRELAARAGPAPSMATEEFDLSNPFGGAAPKEENIDIIRKMDWLQDFSMQGQNGQMQNVNLLHLAESLREFSSGINDQHTLAALQTYQGLDPQEQTQEAKEDLLKQMTANMRQQYLHTFNAMEQDDGFLWDEGKERYQVKENRMLDGGTRKTVANKFRHMEYFGKVADVVGPKLLHFNSPKQDEAPAEAMDEAPAEAMDEAPAEALDEAPAEALSEAKPAKQPTPLSKTLMGKLSGVRAAGVQFDALDSLQSNTAMYLKYGLGEMSPRDQKKHPEYARQLQAYRALTENGTRDFRRRR